MIRPRKAHILDARQSEALSFLQSWIPTLDSSFTKTELKSAFRQAALKLHPDCGGTTEGFLALREHYRVLTLV